MVIKRLIMLSLKNFPEWSRLFVALAAAATAFIGLAIGSRVAQRSSEIVGLTDDSVSAKLAEQEARMLTVQQELESVNSRLGALETHIATLSEMPEQSAIALEVAHLSDDIRSLQTSVFGLEETILDDPLKAVAIPLLRNDLETLDARQESDIRGMREEIARVYNLATWVIGLMFTLAVGIFVLALGTFFKRPVESE